MKKGGREGKEGRGRGRAKGRERKGERINHDDIEYMLEHRHYGTHSSHTRSSSCPVY